MLISKGTLRNGHQIISCTQILSSHLAHELLDGQVPVNWTKDYSSCSSPEDCCMGGCVPSLTFAQTVDLLLPHTAALAAFLFLIFFSSSCYCFSKGCSKSLCLEII